MANSNPLPFSSVLTAPLRHQHLELSGSWSAEALTQIGLTFSRVRLVLRQDGEERAFASLILFEPAPPNPLQPLGDAEADIYAVCDELADHLEATPTTECLWLDELAKSSGTPSGVIMPHMWKGLSRWRAACGFERPLHLILHPYCRGLEHDETHAAHQKLRRHYQNEWGCRAVGERLLASQV